MTNQATSDERETNRKLPETFISEVKKYLEYYQFIFIFGGEPTLFKEFPDLLKLGVHSPYVRYGTVSNGSIIHKYFTEIEKVHWAFISISLDAATKESYELLRKSKKWEKVNQNLRVISNMKKKSNFEFTIAMTVNSKNCNEIYDFVSLANNYDAIPKLSLVSNPFKSFRFNHEYLSFNNKMKESILEQIERVEKDFPSIFDKTGLNVLKTQFKQHGRTSRIKNDLKIAVAKVLPVEVLRNIKSITRRFT